jgi:hypothetical protein
LAITEKNIFGNGNLQTLQLNMAVIDSRFLRKPWFVIIKNFAEQQAEFPPIIDKGQKLLDTNNDWVKETPLDADKIIFDDETEESWFRDGIESDGGIKKIQYDYSYKVVKHVRLVCSAIQTKTLDIVKTAKPDRIERTKARKLQDTHGQLGVDEESGQQRFLNKGLKISAEGVNTIIDLAIKIVKGKVSQNHEDKDDLECLLAIKANFKSYTSNNNKAFSAAEYLAYWENHRDFWKEGELKPNFSNSKWFCFRRTDARNISESNYGISISPIEIKSYGPGNYSIYMLSKYRDADHNFDPVAYKGLVTVDENHKALVIEMHQAIADADHPTVAFSVMQLGTDKNPKLLLGYLTYYSLLSGRYITKVSVWLRMDTFTPTFFGHDKHKLPTAEQFTNFAINLNPKDNKADFDQIPVDIRKFLSERSQNRLTLPSKVISSLTDGDHALHKWLKPKYERAEDKTLIPCCGDYDVFYYYGSTITTETRDQDILDHTRSDKLTFAYDENATAFSARYTHTRSEQGVEYLGSVSKRDAVVEIVVEFKGKFPYKTTDKNIIYLSYSVPHAERMVFDKEIAGVDYFEGLIAGVNDQKPAPISFLILLRKRTEKNKNISFNPADTGNLVTATVLDFFKTNKDNLRLEAKPHGHEIANSLIGIVSSKGYGCSLDEEKRFVIFDRKGHTIHCTQEKFVVVQQGALYAEEFIRSL